MSRFLLAATDPCTNQAILPDLYRGLRNTSCEVNINSLSAIGTMIFNVTEMLLVVAGFLAVGFIIAGGVFYIISFGEPQKIAKAKDTIVNATLGLGVVLFAYAIVSFISGGFK